MYRQPILHKSPNKNPRDIRGDFSYVTIIPMKSSAVLLFLGLIVLAGAAGWIMFGHVLPGSEYARSKKSAAGHVSEATIENEKIELANISQMAAVGTVDLPPEPEVSENAVKVAVILLNYSETNSVASPSLVREALYSHPQGTRAYYEAISEGRMHIEGALDPEGGDVFGPYIISRGEPVNNCRYMKWADAGEQAALADGFVRSNYDHVLFFFPLVSDDCGLREGKGASPGQRSYYWLSSNMSASQLAGYIIHELGHNFGLLHASSLFCSDTNNQKVSLTRTGICTSIEYGDSFDPLGHVSGKPYLNTHSRVAIGALPPEALQTVTTSGIYSLGPIELASTTFPRGIKIQMSTPLSNGAHSYLLEYRQPIGFDSTLNPNYLNGIFIRVLGNKPYTLLPQTWLLDTTPIINPSDVVLRPNATFIDSQAKLLIRTISVSPTEARVEIKLNEELPNTPPVVQLTAPTGGSYPAGTPVTVRATASDPDGSISLVEFYNGSTRIAKDTVAPYEMVWNPTVGINTLIVKARDNQGLVTTSAPKKIKGLAAQNPPPVVNDVAAPTVYLVSSDPDPIYHVGEVVSLYATAADDVGIDRVEFLQGGRRLGTDTTAPSYTYGWKTTGMAPGTYWIMAVAYDKSLKKSGHSIQITILPAL